MVQTALPQKEALVSDSFLHIGHNSLAKCTSSQAQDVDENDGSPWRVGALYWEKTFSSATTSGYHHYPQGHEKSILFHIYHVLLSSIGSCFSSLSCTGSLVHVMSPAILSLPPPAKVAPSLLVKKLLQFVARAPVDEGWSTWRTWVVEHGSGHTAWRGICFWRQELQAGTFTALIFPDSMCIYPPAHSQTTGFSLLSQMGQVTCSPEDVFHCESTQGKPKSTFILLVHEIWGLWGNTCT